MAGGIFADIFPAQVYAEFNKLISLARDLNTQLSVPEIVLIGRKGDGKTSLLEAILGHTVTKHQTVRPIHLNIVSNPKATEPKVTVKRDSVLKGNEFDYDAEVALDKLEGVIKKRNVPSRTPIYIQYEIANSWNMVLIDTPGLFSEEDYDGLTTEDIESIVQQFCRPSTRTILCVEKAGPWDQLEMLEFVKKIDPRLDRTLFVYTFFDELLRKLTSNRELNRHLAMCPNQLKSFYASLLNGKERDTVAALDLRNMTNQQHDADMKQLESLQYDKRYSKQIGIPSFRAFLADTTWKKYQEGIPEIHKKIKENKVTLDEDLRRIQYELMSLESHKLRATSSNYVMNFLQNVEKLITGTLEGNPAQNGQTLEEEYVIDAAGVWRDSSHKRIRFNPKKWQIPYYDTRLYGGQQFERLLNEFKAVADHTSITTVTMDEVATAIGPNKLNNAPNYAWVASDIAQKKAQKELRPLVDQLFKRAVYIMKRLTGIVDKMLENQKKEEMKGRGGRGGNMGGGGGGRGASMGGGVTDVETFIYFTHYVKNLYYQFIERIADVCKDKCMDEFYCTRIIYWDLSNFTKNKLPGTNASEEEGRSAVRELATQVFDEIRSRLTRNVLLKLYNYFLLPMQSDLWGEIQGEITCMSDAVIEELFDVHATRQKMMETESTYVEMLTKNRDQEVMFLDAASNFSHPK